MSPLDAVLDDIVAANRILAGLGVLDGFGHVSARHPGAAGPFPAFPLARAGARHARRHPDLRPAIERAGRRLAPAVSRALHPRRDLREAARCARRRAQPCGGGGALQRHASAVAPDLPHVAASCARTCRCSTCAIASATPTCSSATMRRAPLSRRLGASSVVLMRGHGYCAMGQSIAVVVFRAYYTQLNAELQQRAMRLAATTSRSSPKKKRRSPKKSNESVMARPWGLWKAKFAPKE